MLKVYVLIVLFIAIITFIAVAHNEMREGKFHDDIHQKSENEVLDKWISNRVHDIDLITYLNSMPSLTRTQPDEYQSQAFRIIARPTKVTIDGIDIYKIFDKVTAKQIESIIRSKCSPESVFLNY